MVLAKIRRRERRSRSRHFFRGFSLHARHTPQTPACPSRLPLAAACLLPLGGAFQAAGAALDTRVDLSHRSQTIKGFGTSVDARLDSEKVWNRGKETWTPGNGASLLNTDAYYDHYVGDLGASAVRMSLVKTALNEDVTRPGATAQDRHRPWHSDLDDRIRLDGSTYENARLFNFDVKGLGNVGRFVQKAARRGDDMTLMAAIWSPPHWMKGPAVELGYSGDGKAPWFNFYDQSAGGSLIDTPDNLQQFGRYVAAYAKGFEREWGVPIDVLSVQNEPRFNEVYDSALYTPELFAKAVGAVNAAFAEHNAAHPEDPILTQLMGPDDIGLGGKRNPNLANLAFGYIDAVRHDGDAATAVGSYGLHGWNGGGGFAEHDDRMKSWRDFRDGRGWEDGRPGFEGVGGFRDGTGTGPDLWVTEHSGHAQKWTDPGRSFNGAMGLALEVHEALVGGDAVGYLYWQNQDAENWVGSGYTLTAGMDPDQPKYAAFKHFSRFVRPGMVRVAAGVAPGEDAGAVKLSAWLDEAAGTLTYVLLNVSKDEHAVQLASLAAGGEVLEAFFSVDGAYHRAGAVGSDGRLTLAGESVWSVVTTLGSLNAVPAVPEPAGALLALAAGGLLLRRRRA